jgi:hypothetical protein
VPAVLASDAKKAMRQDATTKVSLEFVKHEGRQLAAAFFQFRQERRPVLLYGSVQQGRFGTMAFVRHRACGRVGGTACCWLRGKHQQEFSATRRFWLPTTRSIRRARGTGDLRVSISREWSAYSRSPTVPCRRARSAAWTSSWSCATGSGRLPHR